jgi:large subunit ribosomal protein L6
MSRIGRLPIAVPQGVDVKIEGSTITVKGPKGTLNREFNKDMSIVQEDGSLLVTRPSDAKNHKALHGLTRALLFNMVTGVKDGFQKTLEINGVGYKAIKQGKKVVLSLGYSHPVEIEEIDGITIDVPNANTLVISGIDKESVGQFAAMIKTKREPEPYKGKGIKYAGEVIKRKEGKTGKKK